MKSTYAFVALLAFAVLNTGFLGAHLASSAGQAGESAGTIVASSETASSGSAYAPSGTSSSTTSAETTASSSQATETYAASATQATESVTSGTVAATATPSETNQTSSMGMGSESATQAAAGEASSSSSFSSASSSTATSAPASKTSSASTGSTCSETSHCGGQSSFTQGVSEAGHPGPSALSSFVAFFEDHSLALAPGSWAAVGGMWIWRGRMKSRWRDLGFDADVFGLFVKMKGGKTRIKLLDALSLPKDRLQLAQELGMDWKGVDRHLELLKKYGFVQDKVAYGKVRMYELTAVGASLLKLFQELSREEQRDASPSVSRLEDAAADLRP